RRSSCSHRPRGGRLRGPRRRRGAVQRATARVDERVAAAREPPPWGWLPPPLSPPPLSPPPLSPPPSSRSLRSQPGPGASRRELRPRLEEPAAVETWL